MDYIYYWNFLSSDISKEQNCVEKVADGSGHTFVINQGLLFFASRVISSRMNAVPRHHRSKSQYHSMKETTRRKLGTQWSALSLCMGFVFALHVKGLRFINL